MLDTLEERLQAARLNWRMYCLADATIARLASYPNMTRAMRADLVKAHGSRSRAAEALDAALKPTAQQVAA